MLSTDNKNYMKKKTFGLWLVFLKRLKDTITINNNEEWLFILDYIIQSAEKEKQRYKG